MSDAYSASQLTPLLFIEFAPKPSPPPTQHRQHQRPHQSHSHIHDSICHSAHHGRAEEVIERVLVEFPEDDRRPCAGEGKQNLNQAGNIAKIFLRVPNRRSEEIRDRHAAHEVRGDVHEGEVIEQVECQPDQIKSEDR